MLACKDGQAKGDIMDNKQDLADVCSAGFLHEQNFDTKNPDVYVVTHAEYLQLKAEHAKEVEGMSYEEYCESEKECWNEMLHEQLKQPWEKSIPDSLLNPKAQILNRKYLHNKSSIFRRLLLKSLSLCDSSG